MRKPLLLVLCILFKISVSFGQDIYTYTNITTGTPDYTDPLLASFTDLTAIGATSTTACGSGFSGISGWPLATTYSSTGPCIQVTLTASAGYTIKSTGFTAGLRRSGTGPSAARLAYSTDGVTWIDDSVDHSPTAGSCATSTSGTTLASWTSYCVTNTTLYFRIYPFSATSTGGTIQVYGLDIIGTLVPVASLITPTITPTGPTTFCAGGHVLLNATATGSGDTYQWYNSAGIITGATGTSYTATATDNYYVNLTSSPGCTDTSAHISVTVNPSPAATISASGPVSFCAPGSVTLTETSGTGTTYQWYNTSGPVSGATAASFTATTTDRDSVMITNSFGCIDTSAAIIVTSYTPPTAVVTPSGPVSFCPGSSAVLSATTGTGYTYQWYNNTGIIAGAAAYSLSVTAAGRDSVIVTGTGGCTATSNAVIVTLFPTPVPVITASGPLSFCTPSSVTLTETSGTGITYQWYNNSGIIPGATTAALTVGSTGRDSVVVTNSSGCSATSAAAVLTAYTPPVAVVTPAGPLAFCTGGSALLTASTGAGYTYQWFNNSGIIAGATAYTLTVSNAGSDSVVITSIGGCIAVSNAVSISLYPLPAPVVTASGPVSFCTPGSVVLTETSGTGTSYQWYNTSGIIAGATNAFYTASTTGRDSVKVTNSSGCSATEAATIVTANTTPVAAILPAGPVAICSGSSTVLTTTPGAGYTYQWYDGAGIIAGATGISHTVSSAGRDSVVITSAAGCPATANAVVVSVNPLPNTTVTASGPSVFCSNDSVILTAVTAAGVTYQWHDASGAIAGATDATYTVHSSGTYHVNVMNSFGCSANSTNYVFTVHTAPSSAVTYSGPLSFCAGGSVTITADMTAGDTYQWYNATGAIAGAVSSTYTANSSGDYYVVITGINGCITTSASSHIVEVAVPFITPQSTTSFCGGDNVIIAVSTGSASGITYQWMRNGINIPGATGAVFAASTSGDYTCLVTISASCFSTTNAVTVNVFPTPNPVVTYDGIYLNTQTYFSSYQWFVNAVSIPDATTYHTIPAEIGSYRVMVTDTNNCHAYSLAHSIFVLAVNNVNTAEEAKIYPNPTTETLHITAQKNVRAVITNVTGKTVIDQAHATDINVSSLPTGIYMVMLYDENGERVLVQKLVKE